MNSDGTIITPNGRGYTDHRSCFSQESNGGEPIASAWRNTTDRRFWVVCPHESASALAFATDIFRAVTDDFGSLRRVS